MESDIIIGYVSIAVVLGIGITSNYLVKKQFESNKEQHHEQIQSDEAMQWEQITSNEDQHREQHQVQGLLEAFRILDSREHRESRRKVYQLYHEYRENNNKQVGIFKGPEIEDVRAEFDKWGN